MYLLSLQYALSNDNAVVLMATVHWIMDSMVHDVRVQETMTTSDFWCEREDTTYLLATAYSLPFLQRVPYSHSFTPSQNSRGVKVPAFDVSQWSLPSIRNKDRLELGQDTNI